MAGASVPCWCQRSTFLSDSARNSALTGTLAVGPCDPVAGRSVSALGVACRILASYVNEKVSVLHARLALCVVWWRLVCCYRIGGVCIQLSPSKTKCRQPMIHGSQKHTVPPRHYDSQTTIPLLRDSLVVELLKTWCLLIVIALTISAPLAVAPLCDCFQAPDSKTYCKILLEIAKLASIPISITILYLFMRPPAKKITTAVLAKRLHIIALGFIIVVVVVAMLPVVAPTSLSWLICWTTLKEPTSPDGLELDECVGDLLENGMDAVLETDANSDGLLTAAATIMGLTVFGSALGTLSSNKHSIRSIAYTLIPTIAVQAAFMLHLVGITYFPVVVWISMTAVLLMLTVLAMTADKILHDQTDGSSAAAET